MPGLWMYAAPGGAFGQTGTSDRLGLWRGTFFAIEVKRDRTQELTEIQKHRIDTVIRNGGIGVALKGWEEWKLNALKAEILRRYEIKRANDPAFADG